MTSQNPDVDTIGVAQPNPSSTNNTSIPLEKTPTATSTHAHPMSSLSRHSSSASTLTVDRTIDRTIDPEGLEDNSGVPKLSLWRLFWFFLSQFGVQAWGGSVGQIALMKQKLVVEDQWISLQRFQRVFAVYQILPGPEAAELCMFFGCLSAGRWGGVVAGLGFILPGFVLMLTASVLYVTVDVQNEYIQASLRALRAVVAAVVCNPPPPPPSSFLLSPS